MFIESHSVVDSEMLKQRLGIFPSPGYWISWRWVVAPINPNGKLYKIIVFVLEYLPVFWKWSCLMICKFTQVQRKEWRCTEKALVTVGVSSGNLLWFCFLLLGSSLHPSLVRNDIIPHSHQPEMSCPLSFQLWMFLWSLLFLRHGETDMKVYEGIVITITIYSPSLK